jgi:hypothetical protein
MVDKRGNGQQRADATIPSHARMAADSPSRAFFGTFRDAVSGVDLTRLADRTEDQPRVAAAFRAAEFAAAAWVRGAYRWNPELADRFAHALVLCAGNWLLAGSGDMDVLANELDSAWNEVLERA